jgi:hypothetical protein
LYLLVLLILGDGPEEVGVVLALILVLTCTAYSRRWS